MYRLVPRPRASTALTLAAPLVALALTVLLGGILFAALGKPPGRALALFFLEPLRGAAAWSELSVKATPLILIALGLGLCFRANVWNIGAEGQFIIGAIVASWVAMRAGPDTGRGIVVLVVLAGALGGALWAALVAVLRDRWHASEILVSLMLVYVAELVLGYLVYGPWKDPDGYNFPQTITFLASTAIPRLVTGHRAHAGLVLALGGALAAWVFQSRTFAGFQLAVGGVAPRAALYAGFSARRGLWTALLLSGALAGLAGALEVAGPLGQLTPHLPVGYGFAAIIVAFVGRLHPIGTVFSAILMSMLYIGGELAQSRLGLPKAITGVFQGILLVSLLGCDALAQFRLVRVGPARQGGRLMEMPALAMLGSAADAGTVLALGSLGLLVNERAGVVNLGAEGMMLVGALAGYATAWQMGAGGVLSAAVPYLAGAGAGALLALLFAWLVIYVGTNQYATGLALSLFGVGFSAFAGGDFVDKQLAPRTAEGLPLLRDLPALGPALFGHPLLVYAAIALGLLLGRFLFRSRAGLLLRAIGESPESAHALGHPVRAIRLAAVVFGGALCGLAGAYVSISYTHLWVEGLIAGRGWIALALTTFATWRPGRVLLGAYLFGGLTMLQFHFQAQGVEIESHLLGMLPYLATIVVLVLISRRVAFIRHNMPASLGRNFRPGH